MFHSTYKKRVMWVSSCLFHLLKFDPPCYMILLMKVTPNQLHSLYVDLLLLSLLLFFWLHLPFISSTYHLEHVGVKPIRNLWESTRSVQRTHKHQHEALWIYNSGNTKVQSLCFRKANPAHVPTTRRHSNWRTISIPNCGNLGADFVRGNKLFFCILRRRGGVEMW